MPVADVPAITGAEDPDDLSDIEEVLDALGVSLGSAIDVGCGTGRLARICKTYRGFDISPAAVEYCRARGLEVSLPPVSGRAEIVTALSVFTHIDRDSRRSYLRQFAGLAPKLLVDILPGQEQGSVRAWYADEDDFRADLADAGYRVLGTYTRRAASNFEHLYFYCDRH